MAVLFLLLPVAICLGAIYLYYYYYYKPYFVVRKSIGLPGPDPSPLFGNLLSIIKNPDCKKEWVAKYGHTYLYYVGIKPVIYTEDPNLVHTVLVGKCGHFIERIVQPDLLAKSNTAGINPSILFATADNWRRMRRLLAPLFSVKKLTTVAAPLITDCCAQLVDRLTEAKDKTTGSIDVYNYFGDFTLESILSTAFGRKLESQTSGGKRLKDSLNSMFDVMKSDPGYGVTAIAAVLSHAQWLMHVMRAIARKKFPKLTEDSEYLSQASQTIVMGRRSQATKRNDVLQLMVDAKSDQGDEPAFSDNEIAANSAIFLIAGFDTTRMAMSLVAYQLAKHADVQDRVIQEIQSFYADNPQASLCDAANELVYLEMVLLEALRLDTVAVNIPRTCVESCVIDGNMIPKGTILDIPISPLNHNPKLWPNPEKFDPGRFGPNPRVALANSCAFLSFSVGPRVCIGKRLGLMNAEMGLIAVLKKFRFVIATDTDVIMKYTLIGYPINGVKLNLIAITDTQ